MNTYVSNYWKLWEERERELAKNDNPEKRHKILVYGTLRKNNGNYSRLLADGKGDFIRQEIVKGYEMYSNGGFPYCIPVDDESSTIVGEIYLVNDAVLRSLDGLEGVSSQHYERLPVKGMEDEGVEMYIPYNRDRVKNLRRIFNGDWMGEERIGFRNSWKRN